MRALRLLTVAVLVVTCGGATPRAASTAASAPSSSPAGSPSASPTAAPAANGITSSVFAVGQFHDINAESVAVSGSWQALITTKGESDVWILENRIAAGASFGWHSHPGPSLVVVKTGALTLYRADDPNCKPQLIEAGSGFVDVGGDVHVVRNEGSIETVVYVMSLVPHGAARKTDRQQPSNCPSIR